MKFKSAIFFSMLSVLLLVPGVTKPLITIKATMDKQAFLAMVIDNLFPSESSNGLLANMLRPLISQLQVNGQVEVFHSSRSLLATMLELINHDHIIVGLMIGVFGILIPVFKLMLTVMAFLPPLSDAKFSLLSVSQFLSKWSMSDVFVMAILVAFLAVNANEYAAQAFQMQARLEEGFYFFLAYCLSAIVAGQLFKSSLTPDI